MSVFVNDHAGTPRKLVNAEGKVVWQAEMDDWGAVARQRGVRQPIRFQGQWEDEESGFYYNRFRYYDPRQGRYITQDPIGLAGGVNNTIYPMNPVGEVDPLGLTGELAAAVPVAATLALADGPLPIGDAIAVGVLAVAAIASLTCEKRKGQQGKENPVAASGTGPTASSLPPPPPRPDCHKASDWELDEAGITSEHAYKKESGIKGQLSMFDICKCSDGRIRIARTKMCGKTTDFWD